MRIRRGLQPCTWILCVALLGSIVHADKAPKPVRRSATSNSAHGLAVTRVTHGQHARKEPAKKNGGKRGQQTMRPERVRDIQAALIRENYLQGGVNGLWDRRTKEAMARFQSDNRWQAKVVPDSRALIKLGLGPDYAGVINPDTAAVNFVPAGRTPLSSSSSQR